MLILLLAVAGGCVYSEPNPESVRDWPTDWEPPPEDYEYLVSDPMLYEETKDYAKSMQKSGWRVFSTEPVGKFHPTKYILTLSRPRW